MSTGIFEKLPPESKIWVFGAEKELSSDQKSLLETQLNRFVQVWNSHKKEVTGAWMLRHDRFVIVAVDESATRVSGCSVDSLVRCLKEFEDASGANLLNTTGMIFFRERDEIRCVTREVFSQLLTEGVVDQNTFVFDNTIRALRELALDRWEVPAKLSWHGKAFGAMIEA